MDDIRRVNVRGTQYNIASASDISLAPIEAGTTASQAYSKGNLLIFNGRLCKATTNIAQGDTLELNTNLSYDTVANEVETINSSLEVTENGTTAPIRFGIDSNGNYGYKKIGESTVTPFKTTHTETYNVTSNGTKDMGADHKYRYLNVNVNSARYLGSYSANAVIDVSAYGATSASQFLAVCDTAASWATASGYEWGNGQAGSYGMGWLNGSSSYAAPSLSLSGNALTINVATSTVAASAPSGSGSHTYAISTKVYFVGTIS